MARATVALCWLLAGFAAAGPAVRQPNILFILTDDHRWDGVGYAGNKSLRTPHLDRLAREGARFDAFIPAAPVCCPSRATFLTGRYPHQTGVLNNQGEPDLADKSSTIATRLNAMGIVTGFVGKAHLGGDPRKWGFTDCPVWLPGGWSEHESPTLMVNGTQRVVQGHITRILADTAIAFLNRRKQDRWFLWLATTAPHTPWRHDPRHPYDPTAIARPPGWPPTQPLADDDWAGYYSTISLLDQEVGRVLKALDDLGLANDTVVILAGDNGWMMGSHGKKGKNVWFEESARTPAVARWPGRIKPGTVVSTPVSSVDLLPTVLELAGATSATGMEGMNLLPMLTSGTPGRATAFVEAAPVGVQRWEMARGSRWKYVRFPETGDELLYDLTTDPHEQTDLAKSRKAADPLAALRGSLDQWRRVTPP